MRYLVSKRSCREAFIKPTQLLKWLVVFVYCRSFSKLAVVAERRLANADTACWVDLPATDRSETVIYPLRVQFLICDT